MDAMKEKLLKAYDGSYYTISGAGGDIKDWIDGYSKMLRERNIGTISEWIEFTGKDMNDEFGLTGDNRYQSDYHFLAFSLDGLDVGKLVEFKMLTHDRWFDNIVDNKLRRESEADE